MEVDSRACWRCVNSLKSLGLARNKETVSIASVHVELDGNGLDMRLVVDFLAMFFTNRQILGLLSDINQLHAIIFVI